MDDAEPKSVRVSIARLLEEFDANPYEQVVWDMDLTTVITREEVAAAIADGSHALTAGTACNEAMLHNAPLSREYHIGRVAHFVVNGWDDAIELDVGIPSMGYFPAWPIQDGNHRFAAAVYRGDESILADVAGRADWIEDISAE